MATTFRSKVMLSDNTVYALKVITTYWLPDEGYIAKIEKLSLELLGLGKDYTRMRLGVVEKQNIVKRRFSRVCRLIMSTNSLVRPIGRSLCLSYDAHWCDGQTLFLLSNSLHCFCTPHTVFHSFSLVCSLLHAKV